MESVMSNTKGQAALEKAKKLIPRASQTMSKAHSMWVVDDVFPIMADSLDGCVMTSIDGNKFIDMVGGLGTNFYPVDDKVKKALVDQIMNKGINFSLPTVLESELAELLCDIYPCAEQVRFCKNGSDAVSAAVRIARSYSNKDPILTVSGGYNGWSDSIAAASQRAFGLPKVLGELVEKVSYNNLEALEEKLKIGKFACFLMEPVSLEEPKPGYLQGVRDLCNRYNTILIFDEVITGSRWAVGGAQEYYGVTPDLSTIGKAFGSGVPISAIIGKKKYMDEFNVIFFSATYFGETLSLVTAITTLKELRANKEKIYGHVWEQGNRIKAFFDSTCKELGINAHSVGCAPRLNFSFNYENMLAIRDVFHQQMIHRGILFGIQSLITWATQKEHIDQVLVAMGESLVVVADAIKNNNIDDYLKGRRSEVIFRRELDNK